ncbi:hypothetical protein [Facklamia miroungae]|uniref:Peptidase propeptide and YPEB domain-containing protein n=1 Tax=Facklamia miroungae TaxID=120956 RepID=A0A1G7TRE7_9LACT|nr:hypothetical protein [Facklamia miroungae]NKZ29942.1 hypothetical protein [Facklamia miroungae]SDG37896.1 hypothetical protein SAMN05421791_1079 [Facklamia miroungae]
MKKSLKKLALVSMSAITLGAVAPSISIFAQEESETTVETMADDTMSEETTIEEEEADASPLQKALEDIVKKYEEEYPEVGINRITIQPLEEDEDKEESEDLSVTLESEMDMSEETDETSDEEMTNEAMSDEEMVEVDPFEITIEGTDEKASEEVTVSYDARTGEEIPEEDDMMSEAEEGMDDMMSEAEEGMDDMSSEVEEGMDDMMSEESDGETTTEDAMSQEPMATIEFDQLASFDEIKAAAEEEAGMGEALEFVYSVNEETNVTEVAVFVYENTEEPTEGKMKTITLDATTLEVLKVEGSEDEEATDSEGNEVAAPKEGNGENQETSTEEKSEESTSEESKETTKEGEEKETTEEKAEETTKEKAEETTKEDSAKEPGELTTSTEK